MLIKPSIDTLLTKVDSKYTLVIAASQRGRQIRERENIKKNIEKTEGFAGAELKEVSLALDEISADRVTYTFDAVEAEASGLIEDDPEAADMELLAEEDEEEAKSE